MPRILRKLVAASIALTPLPEIVFRYRSRRHLTVLGYHRIAPQADDYPFNDEVISATPEEFARELDYLRRHLDIISMPDLVAGLHDPDRLPARPAVITFDDGYHDNHDTAFPLLRERGLPACFFICTGLVGTQLIPWYEQIICCLKLSRDRQIWSLFGDDDPPYRLDGDHLRASIRRFRRRLRQVPWSHIPRYLDALRNATGVCPEDHLGDHDIKPRFMTWDQVRRLAAAGMEIGGHTRTHPLLACVDGDEVLRDEVKGCYEDIRRELHSRPMAFAYPVGETGAMSQRADDEIERAGFTVSFSFMHSLASRTPRPLRRLPRVCLEYGQGLPWVSLGDGPHTGGIVYACL